MRVMHYSLFARVDGEPCAKLNRRRVLPTYDRASALSYPLAQARTIWAAYLEGPFVLRKVGAKEIYV